MGEFGKTMRSEKPKPTEPGLFSRAWQIAAATWDDFILLDKISIVVGLVLLVINMLLPLLDLHPEEGEEIYNIQRAAPSIGYSTKTPRIDLVDGFSGQTKEEREISEEKSRIAYWRGVILMILVSWLPFRIIFLPIISGLITDIKHIKKG